MYRITFSSVLMAGPQFRPSSSRRLAARDLDIAGGDFSKKIISPTVENTELWSTPR